MLITTRTQTRGQILLYYLQTHSSSIHKTTDASRKAQVNVTKLAQDLGGRQMNWSYDSDRNHPGPTGSFLAITSSSEKLCFSAASQALVCTKAMSNCNNILHCVSSLLPPRTRTQYFHSLFPPLFPFVAQAPASFHGTWGLVLSPGLCHRLFQAKVASFIGRFLLLASPHADSQSLQEI